MKRRTTRPVCNDLVRALPGKVLDAPVAVVALLDKNHKVIKVLRPPVAMDKDADGSIPVPVTTMDYGLTHTIGFVVPPDVYAYSISIGGAE